MKSEAIDNKKTVAVVAKHLYVVENIESMLQKNGYNTFGITEDEEGLNKKLSKLNFDVLFIGGGVEPLFRNDLVDFVQEKKPEVKIVEHFGGPATIRNEVATALAS